MRRGKSFFLGAGLLASAALVPVTSMYNDTYAVDAPTPCDGLENCAVVSSAEDLADFFTPASGRFVTREGESTLIIGGDFTMAADYYITDVNMSIYLGDYTLSMNEYSFLFYDSTINLYGGEGALDNTNGYYAPIYLRDDAELTMHGGVVRGGTVSGGEAAITLDDGAKFTLEDGEVYGETWVITAFNDTEVTMNGGTITTTGPDSIGISGNGTSDPTKDNYGGNAKFNLNAGTINSNDVGVYAPQVGGVTTLGEGLTINAMKVGVEIRAGELEVNGAEINVDENTPYEFNPNGSGSTASGVAIAVAQHATKQAIKATVTDGTFTAPVAFAERNPQHNEGEAIEKVELSITGGVFNATNGAPVVASEDVEKFIEGGQYSKLPDVSYVKDGKEIYDYDVSADGPYFVDDDVEIEYPEELALEVGESYDIEHNDIIDTYATVGVDTDILERDDWTITAKDVGDTIVNINFHDHITPVNENIRVKTYKVDLEVDTWVEDGELELSDDDKEAIGTYATEQIRKLINGEETGAGVYFLENGDYVRDQILAGKTLVALVGQEPWDLTDEEEYEWLEERFGDQLEEGDVVAGAYGAWITFYFVDDQGEYDWFGDVIEMPEEIELSYEVSDDFLKPLEEGYERHFYVIRRHQDPETGELAFTRISATADGNIVKFMNDRFSEFVVVYQDVEAETGEVVTSPETGHFTRPTVDAAEEANMAVFIAKKMFAVMLGLIGLRMLTIGIARAKREMNL